jgi:ketol-acid reductoisomerase
MRAAVLGFGNQGAAQAVCLRASGWEVVVGQRPGPGAERARAAGFAVRPPAEAAAAGEYVALLLPDEVLISLFPSVIAPALRPGSAVVFAHGFALRHGDFAWPAGVDAVLVSPTAPGVVLEAEYRAGRGVPAYCAVAHDASGRAQERAEIYAAAIGATRARLLPVAVEDEVVADLFGEQVVLVGGLLELVTAAVDTLVGAGIPKPLAYLECAHQMRYLAELLQEKGAAGFLEGVSNTARFGALRQGPRVVGAESRRAMTEALEEIRSGRFAAEFLADQRAGAETLRRLTAEALQGRLARLDAAREAALGPPGGSR